MPNADEARAAIIQALLTLNVQPNRMNVTTLPDEGQAQTNVIEFVPPDRKHIASVEEGVEYIVIGEQVYAYTKSAGQWAETQIPASTFMGDQEVTEATLAQTISEAQFVREDALDGKAVMVYNYLSTTRSGDIELHSQVELWVGKADGRPYKMINDGEILAASTDPTTGESKLQAVPALTTTLITFDATINIEPPVLSSTPAIVANPTTLRELVQGSNFFAGLPLFTDRPNTFDLVRNHANGTHLTFFMEHAMPSQPENINDPVSYDFSWIDNQIRIATRDFNVNSIYVSHVVFPAAIPDQAPWLIDLYNAEKQQNGQAAAQARVTEIMTAYVSQYMAHLRTKLNGSDQVQRVLVSVLGESGIITSKWHPEGWDPLVEMMGPNYPEIIFDAARAAYPEALLGYTDNYNWTSGAQGERSGYMTPISQLMVDRLYRAGKMDYLGMESIIDGAVDIDIADMAATLAHYNCPIFLPEFEVSEQLMTGTTAERDARQAQIVYDYLSTVAATGQWLGVNFNAIGPDGWLTDPGNTAKFAGPDANGSLFDPLTLQPKIPGAYQAAFEVIKAYLGR
jgi:hypothetical protein